MQNKARMSFDGYPFRLPLSKLPQLSPRRANKDPQFLPRARVSPSQHCRVSKECQRSSPSTTLQGQLHCAWKEQRKFVPVSFSNVASFAYGGHCEPETYRGLFLWIRFILLQGSPFLGLNDCTLQRQAEPDFSRPPTITPFFPRYHGSMLTYLE